MDSVSRLVQVQINFFVLSLGFSVCDVTMGACFRLFGPVYLALGANPTGHFWLLFCVETRIQSVSLEPLNGFLA